nr:hypothetical protein [uncultured Albidiferax sp.]
MTTHMRARTTRLITPLQFLAFAAILLGLKFWLIHTYGNETPFWDQWDAEAANLYIPFLDGQLRLSDLFSAHNEHRIFTTRVLGLVLLQANGLWSPSLEMMINAGLHVATLSLTVWFIGKSIGRKFLPVLLVFTLFVFGIPYAWENTLSGFQSQFYFVLLFSVMAIWLLIMHPPFNYWWWLGLLCAIAAYFSLASGIFSVASVAVTLLLRFIFVTRNRRELFSIGLLIIFFLFGVWGTPIVIGHATLRAANLHQFLSGLTSSLAWPTGQWLLSLVRNLPWLLLVGMMISKRPSPSSPIWFLFALGVWLAGQAVSVAFGRSGDVLSSRYLDLHALGLLVNFAAAVVVYTWAEGRRKLIVLVTGLAWIILVAMPLTKMATQVLPDVLARKEAHSAVQELNLVAYLETSDLSTLRGVPFFQSPYPVADRLAAILESSTLRSILPRNLHAPIRMVSIEQSESSAFVPGGSYASTPPCNCQSWGSYGREGDRSVGSLVMHYETPTAWKNNRYIEIKIAGYPSKVGGVEVVQGNTTKVLMPVKDPGETWTLLRTSVKPGAFELRVVDKNTNAWIAVGQPVAMGRLDMIVINILENWYRFCGIGIAFACIALMLGAGAGPQNLTFALLTTIIIIIGDRYTSVLLSTVIWSTITLGLPLIAGTLFAIRRYKIMEPIQLALWSVSFSGISAYLIFWASFYAPATGQFLAGAVLISCAVGTIKLWKQANQKEILALEKIALPFFLSALFSLTLLILARSEISDPLIAMRTRFSHPLPIDNELPLIFAKNLLMGQYPSPMIGDWLGSDRPPLQSAYFLMSPLFLLADIRISYQVMGTMLQCLWVMGLWLMLSAFMLPHRLVWGAMVAAMVSGVAIVHGVFVWPKLLPILPLALIVALFLAHNKQCLQDPWCGFSVGANAGFAMLCHGGSAFALLGIGLTALAFRRIPSFKFVACAAAGALLLVLPWSMYQHFFDPPGNRLLKWHLAGVIGPDDRTLGEALRIMYGATPVTDILFNKLANLKILFGDIPHWSSLIGRTLIFRASEEDYLMLREFQFFNLAAALGFFTVAPLVALFKSRNSTSAAGVKLIILSGFTSFIWIVMMYGPGETTIHQGSLALPIFMLSAGFLLYAGVKEWLGWGILIGQMILVFIIYFSGHFLDNYSHAAIAIGSIVWMVNLCFSASTTPIAVFRPSSSA